MAATPDCVIEPVTDPVIDLTAPQRQAPIAIVLLGVRALRSLGIAQLIVLFFFLARGAADGRLLVVGVVVAALLLTVSVLSWWRYTFQLIDGELVVTKGVLRIDRLTVAVGRIQSITIEQELLHRLTDVVKVVVDTAGTSQAEFTIDAVSLPVAEELRRRVAAGGAGARTAAAGVADPAAPAERIVFQHTPRRLLAAALTMSPWAGVALIVPLWLGLQQALEPVADDISDAAPDVDVDGLGWWLVPIIVIAAPLFIVLLNISRVFFADWQLALRTDATTLRRTSGLLSRFSTTSSVARVQVLTSRQNWLQRRAGLREVHLSNIGEGDISLVGCRDGEFAAAAVAAGLSPIDHLALDRRVHPAEVWLRVRNTAIVASLVTVAAALVVGWWATLVMLVVLPVWWTIRRHVRTHRWSLGAELATTSRVISSSTEQALLRKANVVRVTQTIFERRRGLGRVEVVTAAGTISVGMIPIDEAYAARDVILHGVETDHRAWM